MPGIFEDVPFELILASSSPRRRELLGHLGVDFSIAVPDIEERWQEHETPASYVQRNALEKALAISQGYKSQNAHLVIGADTVGVQDAHVLEKPLDAADACRMLESMSGRSHEVLTGLALVAMKGGQQHIRQAVVSTRVLFKTLSPLEIAYYVQTGEALDKAGAYGIQGIGGFMVERIEGSYSNVVGLPLVELTQSLRELIGDLG